jgi:hypothetical protein
MVLGSTKLSGSSFIVMSFDKGQVFVVTKTKQGLLGSFVL